MTSQFWVVDEIVVPGKNNPLTPSHWQLPHMSLPVAMIILAMTGFPQRHERQKEWLVDSMINSLHTTNHLDKLRDVFYSADI